MYLCVYVCVSGEDRNGSDVSIITDCLREMMVDILMVFRTVLVWNMYLTSRFQLQKWCSNSSAYTVGL